LRASLLKISGLDVHPCAGLGLSSTLFEDDARFSERPWGGSSGPLCSGAHLGRDGPSSGGGDGSAAGVDGLRSPDRPPELGQEAVAPPLIPRQERRAAGGGAGAPPPCRQPSERAGVWDEPASGGWDGPGTGTDHHLKDGTRADHHRSPAVLGREELQREYHPREHSPRSVNIMIDQRGSPVCQAHMPSPS